jgi:hypothetical protein
MSLSTKKKLLIFFLFVAVIIIIGVVIFLISKGILFKKKEPFAASDSYSSDFDYVVSFIKNLSGL